jgi:hypothetical protein
VTAERDGAKEELADLTTDNLALLNEVAFLAAPIAGGSAADVPANIKGTLSGGGTIAYAVTTPHGLRITVKNYKDLKVDAILKPLVGTEVELGGTHKPLAMDITVTTVNGVSVDQPAPAPTSTTP